MHPSTLPLLLTASCSASNIREVQHIRVVTIVDEAHLLKRETLEEIRFLLNYHMDSMNPMALILVGQDELLG